MIKEDLRVVKTLEAIDASLLTNLKKYPLSKITVDTLCKEARINRSTFYKYYSDKYDLLNNYLSKILSEFKKKMDVAFIHASPNSISEEKYSSQFHDILNFISSRKDIYTILWDASMERNIYVEMIDIIQENILEQMEPRISNDSESYMYVSLFSRLFPSNLMMSVRWWFEYHREVPPDVFTRLTDHTMSIGIFKTFKEYVK